MVDVGRGGGRHTLVEVVLVLLTLLAAASSGVELVTDATEEATGAGGLLLRALALDDLLVDGLALVVTAASELVDEIHDVCLLQLKVGKVGKESE